MIYLFYISSKGQTIMKELKFTVKDLSAKAIKEQLCGINIGDIFVLETVNSTNVYAKELAQKGAKHNTVVIADHQTCGKGRMGREFFSPSDTGLYMSIILRPDGCSPDPTALTIAAGVAVCRVIEGLCDKRPQIKWVNDIFLNKKKVCGILAEAGTNSGVIDYIIIGIGINVSTQKFPAELSNIAGSLEGNINRSLIAGKVIREFHNLQSLCGCKKLIEEYKSRSLVLGKKIDFTKDGKFFTGIATDINNEGNLIVTLDNGNDVILNSGEISLNSKNFTNT